MAELRLVLFDLDGTLVETAPEIADAVNDTLRGFGWPEVDEAQVARWIGHGTGELLIQALARSRGRTAEQVRADAVLGDVRDAYDRHYAERCGTRSRVYPGARVLLAALHGRRIRRALVTNKERRYTERVLAAHHLAHAFDRVICGDTLATRKPDPGGAQACLREFGVAPDEALYLGDSAIDVATARAAGVPVWLLPHGYNQGEPIEAAAPDRIVADFGAVLNLLENQPETSP